MKSKTVSIFVVLAITLGISMTAVSTASDNFGSCGRCHPDIAEQYSTSLHYTWNGIEHEYAKGAGEDFGLTVPDGCRKCHTPLKDCEVCHTDNPHNGEISMDTCLHCHKKRPGPNYCGKLAGHKEAEGLTPDVHYEAGMTCIDCHTADEIHGGGVNERLAVQVQCEDCHTTILDIPAHTLHSDKVDCAACHSAWHQTCVNCHLETSKTDSSTTDLFYLGMGHEGKIVPFYNMTMTYENKTVTHWVERTPHTITKDAHDCGFCHGKSERFVTEDMGGKIMIDGGTFVPDDVITKVGGTPHETPEIIGFSCILAIMVLLSIGFMIRRKE